MTTSPSNLKTLNAFLGKLKQRLQTHLGECDDWEIIIPPSEIMAKKQGFPFRVYNKRWLLLSEKPPKLMYAIEFTKDHCKDIRMGIVRRDQGINISDLTTPYGMIPESRWWLYGIHASNYYAGDFIKIINKNPDIADQFIDEFIHMIDEFEHPLCAVLNGDDNHQPPVNYAPSYTQTDYDRYIIAQMMRWFNGPGRDNGQAPSICLSDDIPPLFEKYDAKEIDFLLKEKRDHEKKDRPNDAYPVSDYAINIEDLLGCYSSSDEKITLFSRGIALASKGLSIDPKTLITVVLVHEYAHWIMHRYPLFGTTWNTRLYQGSATELHEGWAQLLTHWVAEDTGKDFKHVFNLLNRYQSSPYHVFKMFTSYPREKIIRSLYKLRKNHRFSDTSDWDSALF